MSSDVVYLSAPCDFRGCGKADMAWSEMRLFQPLLGQDAQMAAIAGVLETGEIEVRVLSAPEIYSNRDMPGQPRLLSLPQPRAHVRFGTLRLPRVLKGAANSVVIAEDISQPTRLGKHPYAGGARLPAGLHSAFVYDEQIKLPSSFGPYQPRRGVLHSTVMTADVMQGMSSDRVTSSISDIFLQEGSEFDERCWYRWSTAHSELSVEQTLAADCTILVPFNLAAPGSLIPDLLQKAKMVASRGRIQLVILLLPFNDVPGSLSRLKRVLLADTTEKRSDRSQVRIIVAKTRTITSALALIRLCRRAWIDATDPEWRWTVYRLAALGLHANFISEVPREIVGRYQPGHLTADEEITIRSDDHLGGLFWRTRTLSVRRIEMLAKAICAKTDHPLSLTSGSNVENRISLISKSELRNAIIPRLS